MKQKSNKTSRRSSRHSPKGHSFKSLLVAGLFIAGGGFGSYLYLVQNSGIEVLAYATNTSVSGLHSSTNAQRIANGLPAFGLNVKLNVAAQSKAADMVAQDYWSHTSPNGDLPWDFISRAGYSYQAAGENLAYGSLSSSETVQAWMDSAGHRANILRDTFTEVGYGFTNSENYQGSGPQTVVVAMYASPYYVPPPPAPTPAPQPAPTPAPTPVVAAPAEPVQSQPASEAAGGTDGSAGGEIEDDKAAKEEELLAADKATPTLVTQGGEESITPVSDAESVRRIEAISGVHSAWIVSGVLAVGTLAGGVTLYRHSKAWHRRIIRGEQFFVHHPLIDAAVIIIVILTVVLLQTVGQVL